MEDASAIELVLEARPSQVGNLTVARLLPWVRRRTVGPFVFLDHLGPVRLEPGHGFDVLPHPHIGLSTVTYLYAGENVHRDSLGTCQVNRALDLNLMTAGRGVAHSERTEPGWRMQGGLVHGVQLWLGLPRAQEDDPPTFEHHPARSLPAVAPAPGVRGRVLLGSAFEASSPVAHPSQPLLVDLEMESGARLELAGEAGERGVLVVAGQVRLEDQLLGQDHLAVLRPHHPAPASATSACRLLLLGGPALDGPRYLDWNFVASSRERLAAAVQAWRERRFPPIPGDDQEFVPYPDRPGPPPARSPP